VTASLMGKESVISRITAQEERTELGVSIDRPAIWHNSWMMFKEHPLWGIGLGAFPTAYSQYDRSNGLFRVEQAHNDYLQVLTDLGLFGGLFLLYFICSFFTSSFRRFGNESDFLDGLSSLRFRIAALTGC